MQRLPIYNHTNPVYLLQNGTFLYPNAANPTMNNGFKFIGPEGHLNNMGGTQAFSPYQHVWFPNMPNVQYQHPKPNMIYNNIQFVPVNGEPHLHMPHSLQQTAQPHMQHSIQPHMQQSMQLHMQQSIQPQMQQFMHPHMQQSVQPQMQPHMQQLMQPHMPHSIQPYMQLPVKRFEQPIMQSCMQRTTRPSEKTPHQNFNNTCSIPPSNYKILEKEIYSSSDNESISPRRNNSPSQHQAIDQVAMPSQTTNDGMNNLNVISQTNLQIHLDQNKICHSDSVSPEVEQSNVRNGGHGIFLQDDFINFLEQNSKCLSASDIAEVKHQGLLYLALHGCNVAEDVANEHRNKPCFNKIGNLCARLKQDITRPNNVVSNINSQGTAWAIKDFIFAFTRIMNSWVIIKGYINNNHEGLNNIKSAFSDDLIDSFGAWQNTTLVLSANLIKTFLNLNNFVQKTSSLSKVSKSVETISSTTEQLNAKSTTEYEIPYSMENELVINDTPKGGNYYKTGTYKPIQKPTYNSASANHEDPEVNSNLNNNNESQLLVKRDIKTCSEQLITTNIQGSEPALKENVQNENQIVSKNIVGHSTITLKGKRACNMQGQCNRKVFGAMNFKFNSDITYGNSSSTPIKLLNVNEKIPPSWLNYDVRVSVNTVSMYSKNYNPKAPQTTLDKMFIRHLNIMITSLMSMQNAQYFFDVRRTRLYFPEFCSIYINEFVDVRTIILKCQAGMYASILEVVIDVKNIPYLVRMYCRNHNEPDLIQNACLFEMEFNNILGNPPFAEFYF